MSPDLLPIHSILCRIPSPNGVFKFRFSFHPAACRPTSGPLPRWARMEQSSSSSAAVFSRQKEKLVVIIGATGTGKSRLSVDLASRFDGEIINSDKMQVYEGLDTTTNKIPLHERRDIPHHLLGEFDPESQGELTRSEFRSLAGTVLSEITARRKLPILAGGSNSFIHALLVDRFDPESDVFNESQDGAAGSDKLRFDCCFLWVDVSLRVLEDYLSNRVENMLDSGMFEELAEFYDPEEDHGQENRTGLRKAIGVPEFDRYFENFGRGVMNRGRWDRVRREAYDEAVRAIKENTCELARRQLGKIMRLKVMGWDLQRVEATDALMLTSETGERSWGIWETQVLEPSVNIVKRFLEEQ